MHYLLYHFDGTTNRVNLQQLAFRQPQKNSRLPFGKRELQLDINLDGQVLPLIAAQVLAVGFSIRQCFLAINGKVEVLCQDTVPKPATVQTLAFTHKYGIKIFQVCFNTTVHCVYLYARRCFAGVHAVITYV